jgi:hypothetical protein
MNHFACHHRGVRRRGLHACRVLLLAMPRDTDAADELAFRKKKPRSGGQRGDGHRSRGLSSMRGNLTHHALILSINLSFPQQMGTFLTETFGWPQCRHSLRFDCLRFEIRAITGETSNGRKSSAARRAFLFIFVQEVQGRRPRSAPFILILCGVAHARREGLPR